MNFTLKALLVNIHHVCLSLKIILISKITSHNSSCILDSQSTHFYMITLKKIYNVSHQS